MGPGSTVLVDEMVIPEAGCHYQAAELDITMMANLGAMERTRQQWDALFAKASLCLKRTFEYEARRGFCIMELTATEIFEWCCTMICQCPVGG